MWPPEKEVMYTVLYSKCCTLHKLDDLKSCAMRYLVLSILTNYLFFLISATWILELNPKGYQVCPSGLTKVYPNDQLHSWSFTQHTFISSKIKYFHLHKNMLRVLLMPTTAAGADELRQQQTGPKAVPLFMSGTTMLQAPLPFFTSGNKWSHSILLHL